MSDQSPYEILGVAEGASFEEIQSARTRLAQEYVNDPQGLQALEVAYDAVLMERLRLRQEGKIKVPDGIRFAENKPVAKPQPSAAATVPSSQWLQRWVSLPNRWELLAPTLVYLVLMGLVTEFYTPQAIQVWSAIATGAALVFLYRKERKLGRATLLGFGGLLVGVGGGSVVIYFLQQQFSNLPDSDVTTSWITLGVLWLVSSFLK
jgi:hypothetical protein